MRSVGILALFLVAAAIVAAVWLSVAGGDPSVVLAPLVACFWGALAVGLVVRLVRARLRGRPAREELRPVADAAAVYNELLTSTLPAAVLSQRLQNPAGADKGTSV